MMKKLPFFDKKISERFFLFFAFIMLLTASIISFRLPAETRSIIPFPQIIIPLINTTCTILCFITIFKMTWYPFIISPKNGQKIPKITNLQYNKGRANYGTKKKSIYG